MWRLFVFICIFLVIAFIQLADSPIRIILRAPVQKRYSLAPEPSIPTPELSIPTPEPSIPTPESSIPTPESPAPVVSAASEDTQLTERTTYPRWKAMIHDHNVYGNPRFDI